MSQIEVMNFMQDFPQPMNINTCMLDLVSEVGELAKEVNVGYGWDRWPDFQPRDNLYKELGQVLFAAYQLAEVMGVDADGALVDVIRDFESRHRLQGHTGSSDYLP